MRPRTRKRVKELELEGRTDVLASTVLLASARKRQGNSVGRSNSSGKHAHLLEMPIETFTEIACYMSPEDLLNLARTSAGLRELLMSKASKRIWEAARTVQGIPECPSDLSDPQYADLLFGKGCSFCSETRTRKTYIALRVRACKLLCFDKKIISVDALLQEKNYHTPDDITIQSMIPTIQLENNTHYGNTILYKAVASQLIELLEKFEELSSSPTELRAYIEDRQNVTRTILESKGPIELWMHKLSEQKELLSKELMEERRVSIEERLRALGYGNCEDFDTRYDEKGWKWKQLLDQTRPVSDRVWQNIKPQLERTIQLRRVHAGPKFRATRRNKRLEEMRQQHGNFRLQLNSLPMGKLFLAGDFLQLPVVQEVMEENDFRIPVTAERCLSISDALPDAVAVLANVIEKDCVKMIKDATLASGTDVLRLHFDGDDLDQKRQIEEDQDQIPTCLLSATALFRTRWSNYSDFTCDSYAEILWWRSLLPLVLVSHHMYCPTWYENNHKSSRIVVTYASILLEHLRLPRETTMSYMLACGCDFYCLRCSGERSMAWPELVEHFMRKFDIFEDLRQRNKKRKLDVPIRNDHDLANETCGKVVSKVPRTTVDMAPTGENAGRYSVLWISWGKIPTYSRVLESVAVDDDSEDSEDSESEEQKVSVCKLCKKLDIWHSVVSSSALRTHMRARHGTDLEGNLLPEDNTN